VGIQFEIGQQFHQKTIQNAGKLQLTTALWHWLYRN